MLLTIGRASNLLSTLHNPSEAMDRPFRKALLYSSGWWSRRGQRGAQVALFPCDTRSGAVLKAPLLLLCLSGRATAESDLPLQVPCTRLLLLK